MGIGGLVSDIFGGDKKVTTKTQLTPEQTELIQKQIELAEFQLEELANQRDLQTQLFGDVGEALDTTADFTAGQIERAGAASAREVDLINEAVFRALEAGEADIERFQSQATEQLREELAPQLGLRPGDTPILDRGSRIASEATRQQGQLVSRLRGQQAESLLNFPLQRGQFLSNLNQSAFTNRLQLAGAQSTAGLGLAGVATPNIGPAFSGLNQTQTTGGLGFGELAGGIGGILQGLGAIGQAGGFGAIPSSRQIKNTGRPVDEKAVLDALASLPIETWSYIGEETEHVGPYAEDFKEAFGVGDGKTISVVDAIGVMMAAMKALANREIAHAAA